MVGSASADHPPPVAVLQVILVALFREKFSILQGPAHDSAVKKSAKTSTYAKFFVPIPSETFASRILHVSTLNAKLLNSLREFASLG